MSFILSLLLESARKSFPGILQSTSAFEGEIHVGVQVEEGLEPEGRYSVKKPQNPGLGQAAVTLGDE